MNDLYNIAGVIVLSHGANGVAVLKIIDPRIMTDPFCATRMVEGIRAAGYSIELQGSDFLIVSALPVLPAIVPEPTL